jgi:hypothetical protein
MDSRIDDPRTLRARLYFFADDALEDAPASGRIVSGFPVIGRSASAGEADQVFVDWTLLLVVAVEAGERLYLDAGAGDRLTLQGPQFAAALFARRPLEFSWLVRHV